MWGCQQPRPCKSSGSAFEKATPCQPTVSLPHRASVSTPGMGEVYNKRKAMVVNFRDDHVRDRNLASGDRNSETTQHARLVGLPVRFPAPKSTWTVTALIGTRRDFWL